MEGLDTWLTPLEIYFKRKKNRRRKYAKCLCKCGNIKEVAYSAYKRREVKSCGCYSTLKKKNKYGYFNRVQGCLNIIEVEGRIYYPLFNFYGYYTDIEGNIYSDKTKKILKHKLSKKGYHRVTLSNYTDKANSQIVHRMVADVFIINKGNFPQVNHKDFNKDNNHANNLEWCSNEYNTKHRMDSYRNKERKNPVSKLNEEIVRELRRSNMTHKELANYYGVSRTTIREVREYKYWRWVSNDKHD